MNLSARRARRAAAVGQPVAQKVVLAQHMEAGGGEAAVQRQHGDPGHPDPVHLGPALDPGQRVEAVVGQHLLQPLRRALAVGGEQRLGAGPGECPQMRHDGVEQVDRAVGALGRELARRVPTQVADGRDPGGPGRRHAEGRELPAGMRLGEPAEALLVEIEHVRRQRPVGGSTEAGGGLRRVPAGLVVLADQGGTGPHRVLGQMVEADLGPGLEIGEQRHQLVMEQRQPVLHAREAAARPPPPPGAGRWSPPRTAAGTDRGSARPRPRRA